MPTGVLISVPKPTIIRLPTIALRSPPAEPGGGVSCVNSVGESASNPRTNSTPRIHRRKNMPNAIVASDMARLKRFFSMRRW